MDVSFKLKGFILSKLYQGGGVMVLQSLVIVVVLLSGCTSIQSISPDSELIINANGTLITSDDKSIEVYSISLDNDSLHAFDLTTQDRYSFHVSQLDRLIVKNHLKGALIGASIGALTLGVPTYLLFAPAGTVYGNSYGMIMGSIGGAIGSIPGALMPTQDHYIFEYDSAYQKKIRAPLQLETDTLHQKLSSDVVTTEQSSQPSLLQNSKQYPSKPVPAPKNQIAGNLFFRPGEAHVETVFGITARRFFHWERGSYLQYSYRYVEGISEKGVDGYRWNSTYHLISCGIEGFRYGSILTGSAGFVEFGINYASRRENKIGGPGISGAMGYRIWSTLLFGEAQISYDSLNRYVIPCFIIGYRF